MRSRGFTRGLVAALAGTFAALAPAAGAGAASVSYIGADGDVWLTSPNGALEHQVTHDGTADEPYRSPTQQNDGTVVAIRKVDSSAFAHFLDRQSGEIQDSWLLPASGTGLRFAPYTGGQITPDGGMYAYDYFHADGPFNDYYYDFRVGFVIAPGLTNPCAINCEYDMTQPRWVPGTPYVAMIDEESQGIWIQSESGPQSWFGYVGYSMRSFDIRGGRVVSTVVPDDAGEDAPETLVVETFAGTPPAEISQVCVKTDFAPSGASPRLSPDGSRIAWTGAEGVYVAPTPTDGDCALNGTLVGPGGSEPDWGSADTPGGTPQPPDTEITSGPGNGDSITDRTPTFAFASIPAGASFECRVDDAAFANCSSPRQIGPLANGEHTFRVRAKNAAGADESPAVRTFTVTEGPDTVAPETTIQSGPAEGAVIADASPRFTFSANEPGSFTCLLDGAELPACSSPIRVGPLEQGQHTFSVAATDGAGNTDPSPATRTFTYDPESGDSQAPIVSIDALKVSSAKRRATARFSGYDDRAGPLSFSCRIDAKPVRPCVSPATFRRLRPGPHTLRVRATDAAGNTGKFTVRTFRIRRG